MSKASISHEEIDKQLHEDELAQALKRLGAWSQRNSRSITIVLVLLIVAVVGWQMMKYREARAVSQSNINFTQAQQSFDQGLFAGPPGSKEREKPLREAIRLAQDLRQSFPGTPAARSALHLEASALLALGDPIGSSTNTDEAMASLRSYADTAKSSEDKARGLIGLAVAYENRAWLKNADADRAEAEKIYEQVLKLAEANSYLVYEAKLGQAAIYADRGEIDKAATLYREIASARPSELPPESEEISFTSDTGDPQRKFMRQFVRSVLERTTYASIAEAELKKLVPASATLLELDVPGKAPVTAEKK